jgi:hypothetical protein
MGAPDRLNHIWYQSFHQMEMAPVLVGATRETCRTYIGHFLKNWSYRKDAFDAVLEAFTDNFMKAGNLAGGFAHYRAAHAGRVRMMQGETPKLPPIVVPTCVRWAEPIRSFPMRGPIAWARLSRISISRCFPAWDISRTGKIPIARQARSRPSSTGEAELLLEHHAPKKSWDRRTR